MDYQVLFNIAVAVCGFFGGFMLTRITNLLDRVDNDVRAIPVNYVSKTDFKDAVADLKDSLSKGFIRVDGNFQTVFEKLDRKEDKS